MLKRRKKYIKENYEFEINNNTIYIVGVPSGEAILVERELFSKIYEQGLLQYSTKYSSGGFFIFYDVNRPSIMRMINPKYKKDYIIFENNMFNDLFLKQVRDYVEKCEFEVELYVNDNFMGITFGKSYIEIEMLYPGPHPPVGRKVGAPKYFVLVRYDSREIDKYTVKDDKALFENIDDELSAYTEKLNR